MKRLYASLHIAPSPRAQAILFDEEPPPDSRLFALKRLSACGHAQAGIAQARTPADQARAIVEHKIPYRVAASVIRQMTPTVLVALIDRMSSQELINCHGPAERGATDSCGASGNTSCGVAVKMMRRQGQVVEQIVMVTDEGENTAPYFAATLQRYREELAADPHVVFVKTQGASNYLERECQRERITFDAYQFAGDYYALPNLLPLLTRPSKLDLLLEIMAYPLPVRRRG